MSLTTELSRLGLNENRLSGPELALRQFTTRLSAASDAQYPQALDQLLRFVHNLRRQPYFYSTWSARTQLDFVTDINCAIFDDAKNRMCVLARDPPLLLWLHESADQYRNSSRIGPPPPPFEAAELVDKMKKKTENLLKWKWTHSSVRKRDLQFLALAYKLGHEGHKKWANQIQLDFIKYFDILWFEHDTLLSYTHLDRSNISNPARYHNEDACIAPEGRYSVQDLHRYPRELPSEVLPIEMMDSLIPAPGGPGGRPLLATSSSAPAPMTTASAASAYASAASVNSSGGQTGGQLGKPPKIQQEIIQGKQREVVFIDDD